MFNIRMMDQFLGVQYHLKASITPAYHVLDTAGKPTCLDAYCSTRLSLLPPSWVDHDLAEAEGYSRPWDAQAVVASWHISEDFLPELEKQLRKPHNIVPGINIGVVQNDNSAKDGPSLRKAVTTAAMGVKGKVNWLEVVVKNA